MVIASNERVWLRPRDVGLNQRECCLVMDGGGGGVWVGAAFAWMGEAHVLVGVARA